MRVIKLFRALPRTGEAQVIGRQLLRSATSVAANYRAVCRARSDKEFISKVSVVIEEADESEFWIELLIDSDIVPRERLADLLNETNEIVRIMVSSRQTISERMKKCNQN